MTTRFPSMPVFVADFLSSGNVRMMTLAETGAYALLLFNEWQEGPLPDDPDRLARLCNCTRDEFDAVWPVVSERFQTDKKGRLYNRKCEEVRKEYKAKSKKRSVAGAKGAAKRWQKDGNAIGKKKPPVRSGPIQSIFGEKKEEGEGAAAPRPASADSLSEAWEKNRGNLPALRGFPAERRKKCQARLQSHATDPDRFLADFTEAIQVASQTPFCLGVNKRNWRLTFDFLVANDTNYLKVLEGNYSDELEWAGEESPDGSVREPHAHDCTFCPEPHPWPELCEDPFCNYNGERPCQTYLDTHNARRGMTK